MKFKAGSKGGYHFVLLSWISTQTRISVWSSLIVPQILRNYLEIHPLTDDKAASRDGSTIVCSLCPKSLNLYTFLGSRKAFISLGFMDSLSMTATLQSMTRHSAQL